MFSVIVCTNKVHLNRFFCVLLGKKKESQKSRKTGSIKAKDDFNFPTFFFSLLPILYLI